MYQHGQTNYAKLRDRVREELRRETAHQEAVARAKERGRKQAEAKHATAETIRAAKALNIPPHPDGWKHRMELERELSIYHKRKRAS